MKIVNIMFSDLRKICRQKYKTDKLFHLVNVKKTTIIDQALK